jgi:hypothetical protein
MDYGRKEEKEFLRIITRFGCQWTDLDSFFKKILMLTKLMSPTVPGDHFQVTAEITVISNPIKSIW